MKQWFPHVQILPGNFPLDGHMIHSLLRLSLCVLFILTGIVRADDRTAPPKSEVPDAIFNYIKRPEADFGWTHRKTVETKSGRIHQLHLVSQKWQGILWEHALYVYEPTACDHPEHLLLFVTGGSTGKLPNEKDQAFGLKLAEACRAPVAVLWQVPNQPLLDNRKEDDLITETWLRYLKTGDETWPLLFPMVKSAVKAMDALQAFSAEHLPSKVRSFVITGASKRGWTGWLTPVVDARIVGTAPIVIDMLNFLAQTDYQKATWGKYSEQIHDYTSKGLVKTSAAEETSRERQLRVMMDPYTYRRQLTLPKLMIVGTNDRYWVVNAMNLYWDDLDGPKYVLQVPNAGHDLGEGKDHALNTLSIFFQHIAADQALPELRWELIEQDGHLGLKLQSTPAAMGAKLWSATSDSKDFRESKWQAKSLSVGEKETIGSMPLPQSGHIAIFGELQFRFQDRPYSLTTLVYTK